MDPVSDATASSSRMRTLLVDDIGAPIEGTIVSAATVTVAGAHAEHTSGVFLAWAVVLVVYWLTHVYLHALRDQLRRQADPLHRRLARHVGLQAGVLLGGVPVIVAYLLAVALGASGSTAIYLCLIWTILQLGVGVLLASLSAGLSVRRASVEAFMAGLLGLFLVAAKALLH
ncbi:hypothetical protein H1W00_04090 [Aeromicrobium sp. Marseille-Q0843]|uniref:Uncharacterized protein n=1 Tax=Aeromicrobium phoceense TaxID=2754045 RepID=A0A838X817_9ACTN|nr:hypothetical protein [Aeromicrobium phoceense]MBA4607649.1 hypothetical protein [Aeromicrobium phoceense]